LTNVHAPTNKKTEEVNKEFYTLLKQNINQIANSDIEIILGDFNAKVDKEDTYKPTTGNESLHNETNNNRIKMIHFAISKGFNVRNTTLPHKDIHKETWYLADSRTAKQIDHILISNRFGCAVTDIRAIRGPDIGTDHNLLKINFKVKFFFYCKELRIYNLLLWSNKQMWGGRRRREGVVVHQRDSVSPYRAVGSG